MDPLVSVVMLSWNRRNDVKEGLLKLQKQDYKNLEIIVVDNGSEDRTQEMIEKEFKEVRLIKLSKNIGIAGYNVGMEKARGDYIIVLDDDSYPKQDSISQIVRIFSQNPNLGIIGGNILNHKTHQSECAPWKLSKPSPWYTFIGAGAAIKKEVLDKVGYYPVEYFLYHNEIELAARALSSDFEVEYHPEVIFFHRVSEKQRTPGRKIFYTTRNILWFVFKYFPFWLALDLTLGILYTQFKTALFQKTPVAYFKGVIFGFLKWPKLVRSQTPLPPSKWPNYKFFFQETRFTQRKKFPFVLLLLALALVLGFLTSKSPLVGIVALSLLIFTFWLFLNFKIGLVLIILALLFGQLTRFSLPFGGSIVLNDFLIPLVFFVWLLIKLGKKELIIYKTPLNWPLGLFILIAIFSLLLNPAGLLPSEIFQSAAYLFRFVAYVLVFYLVLDTVKDEKTWQKFYSLSIWLGLLFAFLGFLQLIFIPSFEFMTKYGWDPHLNRLLSTFFDPNFTGGFLVLATSLALGRMLYSQNKAEKGLLFFGFLFLLLAIVLTYSRSTYLAFAVAFLIIGVLKSWKLLLFGLVGLLIIFFSFPRMQARILSGFSLDVTAKMRLESFKQAYQIIEDYPIFGTGYNTLRFVREDYGQIQDPRQHTAGGFDSSFLTIWATTGILGLLAYLWLCFRIFRESFLGFWNKKAPPILRGLGLGIFAGFFGLIFHSQFVNSLLYPHIMVYLWFILGLFWAGRRNEKNFNH